jgi:microcystin-dependent protein
MSFRQFGGINYAARHNIVGSNYNTSNNLLVTQNVGQPNSFINFESDISGNINVYGDIDVSGNLNVAGDIDCSGNITAEYMFLSSGTEYNEQPNALMPKSYIDLVATGFNPVGQVNVISTSNTQITTSYPVPINTSLLGPFIIDDYTLQTNDNVLLNDQINKVDNGVYVYTDLGGGSYEFIRSGDILPTGYDANGAFIGILNGLKYGRTGWVQTYSNNLDVAIVGTDDLIFKDFYNFNYRLGQGLFYTQINDITFINVDTDLDFLTSIDASSSNTNLDIGTINATTINIGQSGGSTTTNLTGTLDVTGTTSISSNATVGGTLGVTGATSLSGNLAVSTSKFTVDSGTGNTSVAGTLGVTGATSLSGNLAVNTSKFTVDSGTGNTSVAGTLQVTGATSLSNILTVTGGNTSSNNSAFLNVNTGTTGNSSNPPDSGSNQGYGLTITTSKATSSTTYCMGLGVDYANGFGFINCAGQANLQPLMLNPRGGGVSIGTTTSNASYSLYVSGSGYFTNNVSVGGTLGVTGATSLSGNLAVSTSKFTVDSGTGNTSVAGTLGVTNIITNAASPPASNDSTTRVPTTAWVQSAITTKINGAIPIGGIIMWSGVSVPTNWALCNGQTVNSITTPNLQARFIVGSGTGGGYTYNTGDFGGAATVTLNISEIPAHSHYFAYQKGQGSDTETEQQDYWKSQTNTSQYDVQTTQTGGGGAHENRPPYYALAFIMRVS